MRHLERNGRVCKDRETTTSTDAGTSVVVINDPAHLKAYMPILEELACEAVEPNVFYEPWMLFPALDNYANDRRVMFVLIYTEGSAVRDGIPVLSGFFPLEKRTTYRGIPVRSLVLWRYPHCYLSTPLVRRGNISLTLRMFLAWVRKQHEYELLEMPQVSGHGLFNDRLESVLRTSDLAYNSNGFERALFCPDTNAEDYFAKTLTVKSRKEYRRLQKRLSESGKLSWEELNMDRELGAWIDDFLRLEASGWKGEAGSAMSMTEKDRQFFISIAKEACSRKRLKTLALHLNNRPIAVIFYLLAADGGFAFKMAYNEQYRRYSPGVLLVLELVRRLHISSKTRWLDSCATPEHFLANRLWSRRKPMRHLHIANGKGIAYCMIRLMPLLRATKNRFQTVIGSGPKTA